MNTLAQDEQGAQPLAQLFIAYGESNPSDGFGPLVEIGSFSLLEDAIAAARGRGVQGDPGTVNQMKAEKTPDGQTRVIERPLIRRRQVPDGRYLVGYVDLREFEYGHRPGAVGPVRTAPTSFFRDSDYALELEDGDAVTSASPMELRARLLADSSLVGVWRLAGEDRWRGEFQSDSDQGLDRWLPASYHIVGY